MNQLRNQLVDILTRTDDTHVLVDLFQEVIDEQGSCVYSQLLNILTSLELDEAEAQNHWEQMDKSCQNTISTYVAKNNNTP